MTFKQAGSCSSSSQGRVGAGGSSCFPRVSQCSGDRGTEVVAVPLERSSACIKIPAPHSPASLLLLSPMRYLGVRVGTALEKTLHEAQLWA